MTRINIIPGFLGAGKTTLIKKLLAGGAFEGEKLVLLENEYGEVGVDGAFMKNSGIEITELNSGCICCTLAGDFHDALIELIDKYHPDRVIIEPSGVGKLSEVRNVIAGLANEIDISLEACATVADVNRCRVYARNFGEFFTDQIQSAECIVLSRTQISTQDKLDKAIELLRSINADARIVTTPWDDLPAATLLSAIESQKPLVDVYKETHHHHHHHHDGECDDPNCSCHDHDHDHEHEHEHEHHHEHDEHCDCHEHEHHHDHDEHEHEHHHEHDEHCDCHDHEHHHDHDEHEHHHHHHDGHECHDPNCSCHHDHGHDADEVFDNFGVETAKVFSEKDIASTLAALHDVDRFGSVLRAKGVVRCDDGSWIHFDYVPGSSDIRRGEPDYTGRLCVIGVGIDIPAIKGMFGL